MPRGLIDNQLKANHRKGGMMGAIMGRLFTAQNPGSFGGQVQGVQAAGAPGVAPKGLGQPQSLLQFRGKGDDPHMITVSVNAVGPGGPLTGILFWGAGNGQNQSAEFDIGCQGTFNQQIFSPNGGTLLSVPCTHMELQVRNDANLLASGIVGEVPIGTVGTPNVMASLGVGTKISNTRAYRTFWVVNQPAGPGLAVGGTLTIDIPPFATSFLIMRSDASNSIQYDMIGTTNAYDGPYTVAANARCPETPISGWIDGIHIKNTGATPINRLSVLYFLSL